jgi:hypothetical protein
MIINRDLLKIQMSDEKPEKENLVVLIAKIHEESNNF